MKCMIINQNAPNNGDRAVFYFMIRELARAGVKSLTVSTSNPALWLNLKRMDGMGIGYIQWSGMGSPNPARNILRRGCARFHKRHVLPMIHALTQRAYINDWRAGTALVVARLCCRGMTDALGAADVVLTTGGHRLTTILDRDMVCLQRLDMTLACMLKKRLILWSQSIGPFEFNNINNRLHAEKLLADSSRIYVRDRTSVDELSKFHVPQEKIFETVDSVFGLRDIPDPDGNRIPSERDALLGVSVYARPKPSSEIDLYGRQFAAAINRGIECGYAVRFFPMEIANRLEQQYIAAVVKHVRHPDRCKVMPDNMDTSMHLKEVAKCRAYIAHKTHATIFALLSAVPVLAIAYHSKTRDFMSQFGLSKYCVADAERTSERLMDCFDEVNHNLNKISAMQREASRLLDVKVKDDFRALMQSIQCGADL